MQGAHAAHVLAEPMPGVGVLEGVLDERGVLGHRVGESGGDERLSGGEAPEEGGDADLGASGHLVHRSLQSVLGEDLACGFDDAVSVSLGVRTERGGVLRWGSR